MFPQFTEDQSAIREAAKDFAMAEIEPGAAARDASGEFPKAIVQQLGEMGFLGMTVPESYGGAGVDFLSYILALEQIAYSDASVAVTMSVNNSVACAPILSFGTEAQKQRYLKPLASGEVLGWLKGLGVPVRPWFPALAPIPLQRPRPAWEGVSLREGELRLAAGVTGRRLSAYKGDLVFTKAGVSGPAALELSQAGEQARRDGAAWLTYASRLEPAEAVEAALLEEQRTNPRLLAATWLQRYLPERLVAPLLQEAGLERDLMLKELPKAGRKALVALVTALPLGEPQPVPLARGEVAAGGVELGAVDPRTMALNGWDNLRVCGELLDVDGPVGGYNLQAAFSTGYAAGSILKN